MRMDRISNTATRAIDSDHPERNTAGIAITACKILITVRTHTQRRALLRGWTASAACSLLACLAHPPLCFGFILCVDCPWVGSCVGRRNYRFFVGFIFSILVIGAFVCATSVLRVKHRCEELAREDAAAADGSQRAWTDYFNEGIHDEPAAFALALYAGMMALSVSSLVCYHLNLIRHGETTNESVRGVYVRHVNPYSQGFWSNCYRSLWAPLPPSELNFLADEVTPLSIPGMARSEQDLRKLRESYGEEPANRSAIAATAAAAVNSNGGARRPGAASHGTSTFSYQADLENQHDSLIDDPTGNLLRPNNALLQNQRSSLSQP